MDILILQDIQGESYDRDHSGSFGLDRNLRNSNSFNSRKKFVIWIRCAIYVKFHENIREEILSVPMWDSKRGGGLTDDVPPCACMI